MTREQQRIAIAEWCGIKPLKETDPPRSTWIETFGEDLGEWGFVKRYDQDLNAMHEAESKLTYEQLRRYVNDLALVHMQTLNRNDWDYVGFVHIPANERAEALLRTIGKWID